MMILFNNDSDDNDNIVGGKKRKKIKSRGSTVLTFLISCCLFLGCLILMWFCPSAGVVWLNQFVNSSMTEKWMADWSRVCCMTCALLRYFLKHLIKHNFHVGLSFCGRKKADDPDRWLVLLRSSNMELGQPEDSKADRKNERWASW